MFKSIFNSENWFFRPFGWFVDVVVLSLLWVVCSLVILPFGGATAALYDAASRGMRRGELDTWGRFFRSLKENFRVGIPSGVIVLAVCFGAYRLHGLLYALADSGDRRWGVVYIAFWVLLALANGFLALVFALLSRFEFRLGGLFATTFRFGFAHLPSTLLLGVFTTLCLAVGACFLWLLFFLPCLWALGASLPVERVFRPYMGEQDSAGELPPEE